MADNTAQFMNDAQDATRSIYGAAQGVAETQVNILQRLGQVQQGMFSQAYEATSEQFQLISRVRDPREFAASQAELVKNHGQRYVDSVKQAVDIVAEAWQEYGARVEQGINSATNKAQRAGSSKKTA